MKRKLVEYQCSPSIKDSTRSKKPCLIRPNLEKNEYISASSVINWFNNDCLLDWLKLRKEINLGGNNYQEENFLCEQGNKFEEAVVDYISKNIHPVIKVNNSRDWSKENVRKTFKLLQEATPIIYSAAVRSKNLKLYGTVDLLVRNDYLCKLFTDYTLEEEKVNTIFDHPYHYYVIDIKWCTLRLTCDGQKILNTDRFPGYKGQVNIYNLCLAEMQGYKPKIGFLLGRKYNYLSKGIVYKNDSPFERPGVVECDNLDFNEKLNRAVNWLRDLEKAGSIFRINPPSRMELYPNLGSKYYFSKKLELAEEIGDLSLLYKVKAKKKELAFSKGIYNIYDYRLCGEILNFKGKDAEIINKILYINKDTNQDKILPKKIQNNYGGWKEEENEIFVDFEKFSDIIDDFNDISNHSTFDFIFLIGVGYRNNGSWKYKKFLSDFPNEKNEKKIIYEFLNFLRELGNPKLWYFYAEERFWNSVTRKYKLRQKLNWVDVRKLFIQEPVVIKDCYDYKLKNIIKAMNKHELINFSYDSVCQDGFLAMLNAYKYYQNKLQNEKLMNDIIRYNENDVFSLYIILNYFRERLR